MGGRAATSTSTLLPSLFGVSVCILAYFLPVSPYLTSNGIRHNQAIEVSTQQDAYLRSCVPDSVALSVVRLHLVQEQVVVDFRHSRISNEHNAEAVQRVR